LATEVTFDDCGVARVSVLISWMMKREFDREFDSPLFQRECPRLTFLLDKSSCYHLTVSLAVSSASNATGLVLVASNEYAFNDIDAFRVLKEFRFDLI
jgi:hypothetical protein